MDKPINPDEPTEPTKPDQAEQHHDKYTPSELEKANAATEPGKPPPAFGGAQGAAKRIEDEIAKGPRYDRSNSSPIGDGKGGTAELRAIFDNWLRRDVVEKSSLPKFQGTPMESRLVLEAYIIAILEHSSVVPVHDIGVTRDSPEAPPKVFFTMKKVDGPDVSTIIHLLRTPLSKLGPDGQDAARDVRERFGSIPARLGLFMKVCDAIAFAHDGIKEEDGLHIIHRDLKPANIMVGEFGQVFVMDWGLAKVLGGSTTAKALRARRAKLDSAEVAGSTVDLGRSQGGMGTWPYASPEQIAGHIDQLDRRTDVYALGCFLYHLLTLEMPLNVPAGLNRKQTEEAVVDLINQGKTVPRLRKAAVRSGIHDKVEKPVVPTIIPKALRKMILRAVDPDPAKRPQSAMGLHAAVAAYLANRPNQFEGEGPKHRLYYLVRRKVALFTVIALAALSLSGLVWSYTGLLKVSELSARSSAKSAEASEMKARASQQLAEDNAAEKQKALILAVKARAEAQEQAKNAEAALWRMVEHAVPSVLDHAKGDKLLKSFSLLVPDSVLNDTSDGSPVSLALKAQRAIVSGRHELRYGSALDARKHFLAALDWSNQWTASNEQQALATTTRAKAWGDLAEAHSTLGDGGAYREAQSKGNEVTLTDDESAVWNIFTALVYETLPEAERWEKAKEMLRLWRAMESKTTKEKAMARGIRIQIRYLSQSILHREKAAQEAGVSPSEFTSKAVLEYRALLAEFTALEAQMRDQNLAIQLLSDMDDFSGSLLTIGEIELAKEWVKDAVQVELKALQSDPGNLILLHGLLQAYGLEFDKTFGNAHVPEQMVTKARIKDRERLAYVAEQMRNIAIWILEGGDALTVEGIKLAPWKGDRSRKGVTSQLIKALAHRTLVSCLWLDDPDADAAKKSKEREVMRSSLAQACAEFDKLNEDESFNGPSRCWAASHLTDALQFCIKHLPTSEHAVTFSAWALVARSISDDVWPGTLENQRWYFNRLLEYWIVHSAELREAGEDAESAAVFAVSLRRKEAKQANSPESISIAEENLARMLDWQTWIMAERLDAAVNNQKQSNDEVAAKWQKLADVWREADSILAKMPATQSRLTLHCDIRCNWIFREAQWGKQVSVLLNETLHIFRDSPVELGRVRALGQTVR